MIALLLAAAMAVQGPGALQPGTGIVTGVLKTADGKPAAGVRVGAVDIDDPSASSLLSVTQTDASGRYRLINVPAGNYFIVAGRLNDLKYYPSGADRTSAAEIKVEAARTRADVNFTVPTGSERPPPRVLPSFAQQTSPDEGAYQQLAAEKSVERKAQLIAQFEKTYPRSPRLSDAYLSLMTAYAARNDAPRTVEFGDKVIKSAPSSITLHIQVSRSYASLRAQTIQMDRALAYAEKAVSLARGLRSQAPPTGPTSAAWQNWADAMIASAQENLAWVQQVEAWQRRSLFSLVAPNRR